MGGGGEGGDKDRGNGVGAGVLYKAIMKSVLLYGSKTWLVKGGHTKITRGISFLVSQNDCGDNGAAYGVNQSESASAPGDCSTRDCRYLSNQEIYTIEEGHCCRAGGLLEHI